MHEIRIILDFDSLKAQLIDRRAKVVDMHCNYVPQNKFSLENTDVKNLYQSVNPTSISTSESFKSDLNRNQGKKQGISNIHCDRNIVTYLYERRRELVNSRKDGFFHPTANLRYNNLTDFFTKQ